MDRLIVKTGIVQLNVNLNDQDANIERSLSYISQCAEHDCNIVVLPEAFSTSVNLPSIKKIAEEIPGPTTKILCDHAKKHLVYIVAGIIERSKGKHFSSAVLINDEGKLIHVYQRVHTFALENRFLDAGQSLEVIKTKYGKIGLILGYDINFPESCRVLFNKKAEIIICPAQLLNTFTNSVQSMAIARSAENCCYFVFASSTGANTLAGLTYMGNSVITRNPVGLSDFSLRYRNEKNIIAQAGQEECLLYGELDISKVRREQNENPHYQDALRLVYGHN